MGVAETVTNSVNGIIEFVSGDTQSICRDTSGSSVDGWKEAQIAKAVAIGAGSAVIPVVGYLTLAADLAATLRIMHRAATGICFLRLGHADDDAFAGILAVWSKAVTLDDGLAKQMAAKGLLASSATIGGPVGAKLAIKAFSISAGVIVGNKLGPQVAQKVATKIANKLAGKGVSRWIPFVSAAAGGGINWWILDGICKASEEYCAFIKKF